VKVADDVAHKKKETSGVSDPFIFRPEDGNAGLVCAVSRLCSRLTLAVLVSLALTKCVSAQPCPPLQARNPDGNYIVPGVQGDIPYFGDLALDAYVQRGPQRRASVVVIHGGNWSSGSRVAHVGQLLEALTHAGHNWFSVDYRLGGVARFEDSLADVRRALAFIRCQAPRLGIDATRLVLLGEDSGAHLAALLAAERPVGVIGAVLIGGFYNLQKDSSTGGDSAPDALPRASPIARISAKLPPFLVVHGGADNEVPIDEARSYCDAVKKVKGRCQLVEVPGASHRSENWWPNQWGYKAEVTSWISTISGATAKTHEPHPGGRLHKGIVFSPPTGLKLDAFLPESKQPGPAVIIAHGGGWEAGDKVTYVTPLFEPLARAGLAWFSIDYRLTPAVEHELQLEDLRQAIRFVREEHQRFNVDPKRIILVGESASGQMVAQIATEDSSLAGVVSFYGVYDFLPMVTDANPRSLLVRLFRRQVLDDESREVLRQYSPLHRARKDMPPILLVNGTGEKLWAQAQMFARRLTTINARHEVIALEGAPHGMENWEGHGEWMDYKDRMIEWIRAVTRDP
jgi:alpha-L-fucosidase 2